MDVTVPILAALMITVIGAVVAIVPRMRRTALVATVGCATVALAALLAAHLRRVDTYFDDPGRIVWDNHPDTGFRALVVASLVATALVGLLTFGSARPATVQGRVTNAALALTPPMALATLFVLIAFGAH